MRLSDEEHTHLDELAELYREADATYGGYRCAATTECCRFAITGREPYVTSIEALAVRRALARRGGPLSPRKRALPLARTWAAGEQDEGTCPMLDANARCSIYADRPLGCRTFWCHRADTDAEVKQAQLNALVRRVQTIAARHQVRGDQGRPLRKAVADFV